MAGATTTGGIPDATAAATSQSPRRTAPGSPGRTAPGSSSRTAGSPASASPIGLLRKLIGSPEPVRARPCDPPTRRAALVCFLRHSRLRVGHPTHPESNSQLPTSFRQKLTGDWQNASSRRSGARNTVHQAIPNKPSERTNTANGPRMPLSSATRGATVQSVPITNRQQPDAARSR